MLGRWIENEDFPMRLASALALSAAAIALASLATPADAQGRRYIRDQSERITIIDENGRARTAHHGAAAHYLDGGTQVVPGDASSPTMRFRRTYMNGSAYAAVGIPTSSIARH